MSSILIVDDEKSLQDFLVIMLEEEGYQVVTSPSAEKAIKLIRENIFDLVLTDIRMGRSNGIDVLDAARKVLPDTPVVIMTAYASAETAVTALKVFEQYSWPGNVRELENVIERAVVLETEKRIRKTSLPDELLGQLSPDKIQVPELDQSNIDLEKTLDQIEKKMIANALMRSDGIINKAAEKLNLSFRSMRYRIEKHKLKGKPRNKD